MHWLRLWRQPQIRSGTVALTIIAAIGLPLAFFEQHVGLTHPEFLSRDRVPTVQDARVVLPIEYALFSNDHNDVVYAGDSSCMADAVSKDIEKRTGLQCFNIGIIVPASIDGILIASHAYLSRHPAPLVMIFLISPETCSEDTAGKGAAKDLVRTYGGPLGIAPRGQSCFARALRAVVNPDAVQKGASTILRDAWAYLGRGPSEATMRNRTMLDSGVSLEEYAKRYREARGAPHPSPGADPTAPLKEYPGRRIAVLPEWRDGLRDLAMLCRDHAVRFMVRLAPIRSDAKSEDFSEVLEWLDGFQREFPDVIVKRDIVFYAPSLCWDRRHVNGSGADRFTEVLVNDLREAALDVHDHPGHAAGVGE